MALQMDHYKKMVAQKLDPKGSVQQERAVAKGTPPKPVETEEIGTGHGGDPSAPLVIEEGENVEFSESEKKAIEDEAVRLTKEMIIEEAGRVGIGTSPPPTEIVIEDTGHLRIGDESPSEILQIDTEGSVGIAPTGWEPTAKLEVEPVTEIVERLVEEINAKDAVVDKPKKKVTKKKKSITKKKKSNKK
jgi:hypothetical protein